MESDRALFVEALDDAGRGRFELAMVDPRRKASIERDLMAWRLASAKTVLEAMGEVDPRAGAAARAELARRMGAADDAALEAMEFEARASLDAQGCAKLEERRAGAAFLFAEILATIQSEIRARAARLDASRVDRHVSAPGSRVAWPAPAGRP